MEMAFYQRRSALCAPWHPNGASRPSSVAIWAIGCREQGPKLWWDPPTVDKTGLNRKKENDGFLCL